MIINTDMAIFLSNETVTLVVVELEVQSSFTQSD